MTSSLDYSVAPEGFLVGDGLLRELQVAGFRVRLYIAGQDMQAGLDDIRGLGNVPSVELMIRFAEMQAIYTRELRLRTPLQKSRIRSK